MSGAPLLEVSQNSGVSDLGTGSGTADLSTSTDFVIFDVRLGEQHLARITAARSEIIGSLAPEQVRGRSTSEPLAGVDFVLPQRIAISLKYLFEQVEPNRPILLKLAAPYGFLPLVPWERLLAKQLGRRILRQLPTTAMAVGRSGGPLALCVSPPASRDAAGLIAWLLAFLDALQASKALRDRELHVFLLPECHDALSQQKMAPSAHLHSINPVTTNDQHGATGLVNPWLVAMAEVLRDKPVASFAFLCSGFLARSNGVLVFRQPDEPDSRRNDPDRGSYVAARQLDQFLTTVGAGSVMFLHDGGLGSAHGVRRLQFDLAGIHARRSLLAENALDDATEVAGKWLALADEQRGHEFGDAILYVPPDWTDDQTWRANAARSLAPLVESIAAGSSSVTDGLVSAAGKLSSAVQELGSHMELPWRKKRPDALNSLLDKFLSDLDKPGVDPAVLEQYQTLLDRLKTHLGKGGATSVDDTLRAGRAQAETWLRDQTRGTRSTSSE